MSAQLVRAVRCEVARLERRLALQRRLRRKNLPERPLKRATLLACFKYK